MSYTFKQSYWGTLNKGTKNEISMATSGCGPCSLASIIYNKDTSINPQKVAQWMYKEKYFSKDGSTRTGITKALNHYGFQCLYFTPEHTGNEEWKTAFECIKASMEGQLWAILLVVGTKNGGKDNLWTSGGHFLSVTDYDPKTGKIYVRDSGSRGRTGYYDPATLIYDTNAMWIICKTY